MAKSKEIEELVATYFESSLQENRDLMDEFLDNSTDLSNQTLINYRSALKIYLAYVNRYCKNKHLTEIKSIEFVKYLNFLYRCGLLESAIKLKRSAVSSLNTYILVYYEDDYPTFKNYITKGVKTPSTGKKFIKEPLIEEEIEKLCAVLEENEEWQQLAYLKFSYISACRKNEVLQLLKEVVDYEPIERTITIKDEDGKDCEKNVKKYRTNLIKTKGKKSKPKTRMSFDEDTMYYLRKWLEVRGEDDCEYMFVTGTPRRQISEDTITYWCDGLTKHLGRRFYPHLLRSSRATNLANSGVSLEAIQMLLGHASGDTTKIYICKDDEDGEDEIFAE